MQKSEKQPRRLNMYQQRRLAILQNKLSNNQITWLEYHMQMYDIYEPDNLSF